MRGLILTVGDSTVDHFLSLESQDVELLCKLKQSDCEICFNYGEKIPVKQMTNSFGGSALNCAVGFSRLNLDSQISTFVGRDVEGGEIVNFLKQNKVGCSSVAFDESTNQAIILLYKEERTILSYHKPRNYEELEIPDAQWIYVASAGKGSDRIKKQILHRSESGSNLIFNPGSWELKNFDKFLPIVKKSAIFILNRQEARLVIEDTHDIKKLLLKASELGAKITVITDGAGGAYISFLGNYFHQNAAAVKLADSTGAGDAFAVGFCGGLIAGKSIEESAKWGIINSSSVIESIGANTGLLKREEIEKKLNEYKALKFEKI